ncbi:MAG TPA: ABC transporter ATP-binding protein [Thermoanaerobaculia bacterium]|jgi:ABC-2 type transport system ATP-binding protein/lipopolysaccharide transport system ATP-binding protein|nr:ABC transporter ATP-binding protein [Thermoanaerobaculia bacterium]
MPAVIQLDNVALRYRLARQRIPSFKEYAIHMLRGMLTYRELWALRDVSFSVERGEVVGIVGRNGAGKSTLLKVISGILKPTRGRVSVGGRVSPLLELGTGFDTELTGRENVFLNALLLGRSRRSVSERFDSIVDFAELGEFIDAPLRNYSSGMVARLGFAIATAWKPEVLILDEVLAVGDAAFQLKCHRRLQEVLQSGATVLMVSHMGKILIDECGRCLWLAEGRVVADGDPKSVLAQYEPVTPEPELARSGG